MKNSTKKCAIKQKRKYEYYKNFFEAAQLENKIKQEEDNEPDVDSLRENRIKKIIKQY